VITVVTTAGAAQPTARPLQPQGCYASLTRPPFGQPLPLEPLSTLAAGSRAGHGLPPPRAAPAHPNPTSKTNNQPAWNPGDHTFPSPNVKHHLGQKRQASPGTRHVRGEVRPDTYDHTGEVDAKWARVESRLMPSKVRILDPPHQQEQPLSSTNRVRDRSSLGPVVSGSDRPSTGGCVECVPKPSAPFGPHSVVRHPVEGREGGLVG
jgi:hypothetical protein